MKLTVNAIREIRAARMAGIAAMTIEISMTQGQMFDAILEFAAQIPSQEFAKFLDGFKEEA